MRTIQITRALASTYLRLGRVAVDKYVKRGTSSETFGPVSVLRGDVKLEAWVAAGDKKVGMRYVHVREMDRSFGGSP